MDAATVARDARRFDGVEPVLIVRTGSEVVVPIAHALRSQVTIAEAAASGGALTQRDAKWSVPVDETHGLEPRVGDVLAERSRSRLWTIVAVDQLSMAGRWRLWCRAAWLGIAEELAVLQRPTAGLDSTRAPIDAWETASAAATISVQDLTTALALSGDRETTERRYRVFTEAEIEAGWRVVRSSGEVLNVASVTSGTFLGSTRIVDATSARTPTETRR